MGFSCKHWTIILHMPDPMHMNSDIATMAIKMATQDLDILTNLFFDFSFFQLNLLDVV